MMVLWTTTVRLGLGIAHLVGGPPARTIPPGIKLKTQARRKVGKFMDNFTPQCPSPPGIR